MPGVPDVNTPHQVTVDQSSVTPFTCWYIWNVPPYCDQFALDDPTGEFPNKLPALHSNRSRVASDGSNGVPPFSTNSALALPTLFVAG